MCKEDCALTGMNCHDVWSFPFASFVLSRVKMHVVGYSLFRPALALNVGIEKTDLYSLQLHTRYSMLLVRLRCPPSTDSNAGRRLR